MKDRRYEVVTLTGEVWGQGYTHPRDARESAEHYAEVLRRPMLAVEITDKGKFTSHRANPSHSWQVDERQGESVLKCLDCSIHGPADDVAWKQRKDLEGCSLTDDPTPGAVRLREWEKAVLSVPGAPERIAAIEAELRTAVELEGATDVLTACLEGLQTLLPRVAVVNASYASEACRQLRRLTSKVQSTLDARAEAELPGQQSLPYESEPSLPSPPPPESHGESSPSAKASDQTTTSSSLTTTEETEADG